MHYQWKDLLHDYTHAKIPVCYYVHRCKSIHALQEGFEQPSVTIYIFVPNKTATELQRLAVVIDSYEWSTWHLVHIHEICRVEQNAIMEMFVGSSCSTIHPIHVSDTVLIVQSYPVEEISICFCFLIRLQRIYNL